ncbi:hypothetical protein QR685DRAFT_574421 [Neurospora intermedia]|uniref:Uncharacterized protein n=1 Tax=Neurospora intermedia TaxID=5142 RepID=A0ABR3D4T7_NEUIN
MAAGTVARPKVLYSCWRREHGSGTFKDSLGQPRVSHVRAIHQGLAVHGDRVGSIVCSCGLVSVPFVTTALLVRLSFIAWVRWMQYAVLKMYRPLTTEEWYLTPFLSKPPNGRNPTIPPGRFDINRPGHNPVQTPASTARASAVIPVSPSSSQSTRQTGSLVVQEVQVPG